MNSSERADSLRNLKAEVEDGAQHPDIHIAKLIDILIDGAPEAVVPPKPVAPVATVVVPVAEEHDPIV